MFWLFEHSEITFLFQNIFNLMGKLFFFLFSWVAISVDFTSNLLFNINN